MAKYSGLTRDELVDLLESNRKETNRLDDELGKCKARVNSNRRAAEDSLMRLTPETRAALGLSIGGGKKRKTSGSTSVADEYLRTMSEQEKAKYRELRKLFETWAGVNGEMSNMLRMTTIINKINHSMRLNEWYAEDTLKKTEIIENRGNYCNFCPRPKGKLLAIEALDNWRDRRGLQPLMGGKRKTHRRNKKQRRKKTKGRKKTKRQRRRKTRRSRKKKGGGYTETGEENELLGGKYIKLVDEDGKVVGKGYFLSIVTKIQNNKRFVNLDVTKNTDIWQKINQIYLDDFDKIIVIGQDSAAGS